MKTKKLIPTSVEATATIEQQGSLSATEQEELARCEHQVASGTATAAKALMTIRDKKLYRTEFSTWEEYVSKRWGYSKSYSLQIIAFGEMYGIILADKRSANGRPLLPTCERQVRSLRKLRDAQKISAAWFTAVERANGKAPSGVLVEEVVAEMMGTDCKTCEPKAGADQAPETTEAIDADEAGQREDTPDADAESMNASEETSHQEAYDDAHQDDAESASIPDVAPAPEPRDGDHALQPMQEHGTQDDGNAVGETAEGCVAEAEGAGKSEETATANDVPAQPQVSPVPPRRQASPERVARANKLARICRDAVAGQVSEAEAALIYDLLRTRLAE